MADFQWGQFLTRHRLPHNTRGPNTPHGAITIHCPLCGDADPSDHMVLWPTGGWRCWRNHEHGGKHPLRLVQALLKCSYVEAQRITTSIVMPTDEQLAAVSTMFDKPTATVMRKLEMPAAFRPLSGKWACRPYIKYLNDRGFVEDPALLNHVYGLRYATQGAFRGRVIIPVVHRNKLVSWTGRTIWPAEELRYKSLTTDAERALAAELEPALAPINHYLPWYDIVAHAPAEGVRELVLTEGPLDALKVNLLGAGRFVATCWMGSEPTKHQIGLLHTVARGFRQCWVISDADMPERAYHIAGRLAPLRFNVAVLPRGIKDPAELQTYRQLLSTLR